MRRLRRLRRTEPGFGATTICRKARCETLGQRGYGRLIGSLRQRCVTAVAALSVAGMPVKTVAQTFAPVDDVAGLIQKRRARERLYQSRPAYQWHFQIDTNAGRNLMFADCDRLFCGAFYRSPPFRFTVLAMVGRPLMLSVAREDCLSAVETWRAPGIVNDVRRLPISMADAQSMTRALADQANRAARRNCRSKIDATASRTIRSFPQLQSRFTFQLSDTFDAP
ncbi:hypothetical protein SPMU_24510 [Sphingomonas mucosissima]|uniref:Uncharacterized protein n=1 Tax=Sphingomonas mucosissima TaxID=370959 RepID=A0A245ZGR3_9SPHN|nr:hypothetical protein SPMU_24510 [Sphingomonas mucosissima]